MPTTQDLQFAPTGPLTPVVPISVVPVSGVSDWVTVIAAGGLTVLDSESAGAVLQNPGAILDSSRRMLVRPAHAGTILRARMIYAIGDDPVSTLRIRVFAANSSTELYWTVLTNLAGDASVEIPVNSATDPTDAFEPGVGPTPAAQITVPHPTNHAWDMMGFSHFLVGVERVYTALGGSTANAAYLQFKPV
jgi:hypothetical protein